MPEPADLTGLLRAWRGGDRHALERLVPLVYTELRTQARRHLRKERAALTLQTTALVHELYLRLTKAPAVDWQDRGHFFALAAQVMRRILIDASRVRTARKRGGAAQCADHSSAIDLDAVPSAASDPAQMLCALDDALKSLAQIDPRRARVVELRFFGGLSVEETANLLRVSPQTVMRDWRLAKLWLARELGADRSSPP
jgi:RNA polymerase sigma factor (TIGR02999 family)